MPADSRTKTTIIKLRKHKRTKEKTCLVTAYDYPQALIADKAGVDAILVDQGSADGFISEQLKPELLESACDRGGIALNLRRHAAFDHSYYFIASFIDDHLRWHHSRL